MNNENVRLILYVYESEQPEQQMKMNQIAKANKKKLNKKKMKKKKHS